MKRLSALDEEVFCCDQPSVGVNGREGCEMHFVSQSYGVLISSSFFLFFVFCSGVLVLRDDVMCSALQLAASNIHIHLTPPMNTTPSHSGRAAYTIHRADMHHHHWHWEGKEGGLKELAFSNHVLSIVGSVEEIKLKT